MSCSEWFKNMKQKTKVLVENFSNLARRLVEVLQNMTKTVEDIILKIK
jgi:hypothetical protein